VGRGDLPRVTARDQVATHHMQATGGLVAGPGQVPVPLGPDLQHGGVVLSDHWALGLGAKRRDRHREGVIRVVLVGVPGLEQPHPGGQLGRHVQRAGSPGQRRPPPPRPAPATPPPTPAAFRLGRASIYPQLPHRSPPTLIATTVCELLCGSILIITSAISTLPTVRTEPEGRGGHA
jgi:hypothetical protein